VARKTADVIYNVSGQTVEYRVPQGRPTSATFRVLNDYAGDDETAEFSGTATVESVTQTLSSASGPSQTDPNRINVTSTGVSVDRKYLISEGSRKEWISPVEVGTGYVRAREPLQNNYTTAGTFVGTTITAAIDNTWVADEGNISAHEDPNPGYRVFWSIVVGGVTVDAYSYFDLIRAPVMHEVDIGDVNARAPGLHSSMPTEYRVEQGRPLIEAAWRMFKADCAAMSLDTDAIRDDEILDELVIKAALVVLAVGGWRPASFSSASEYLAVVRPEYDRLFEQHLKVSLPHKLAIGTTGGADVVSPRPMFYK
jgi:hypothetical protein